MSGLLGPAVNRVLAKTPKSTPVAGKGLSPIAKATLSTALAGIARNTGVSTLPQHQSGALKPGMPIAPKQRTPPVQRRAK
jgi:hypothetical protein